MHPFATGLFGDNSPLFIVIILVLIVWTLIIKGMALWRAARGGQKSWFIVLLVVNTIGILELVYLIWFAHKDAAVAESSAPTA